MCRKEITWVTAEAAIVYFEILSPGASSQRQLQYGINFAVPMTCFSLKGVNGHKD